MNNKTDLENSIQRQIRNSVAELDDDTTSKLQQARQYAINKQAKANNSYTLWITGLIASASMAVLVITIIPSPQHTLPSLNTEQWELIVTSEDELDLYNELDFYQWLDDTHG